MLLFVYYSPGLSAAANVDELIKKSCGDADVFVYVCNGTSTLEEPVTMQIAMLYKYTAPCMIMRAHTGIALSMK